MEWCKIKPEDIEYIRNIDLNNYKSHTIQMTIDGVNYQLTIELIHTHQAWGSNIIGSWQNHLFEQVDKMSENIAKDKIKAINMNVSFTFEGLSRVLELKYIKSTSVASSIKKQIKAIKAKQ